MTEEELLNLKSKLAPVILKIPGVGGLGAAAGALNVYLEKDDGQIRAAIQKVLEGHGKAVPLNFVVSGRFTKES